MDKKEVIALAAETAAKVALEELEKQKKKSLAETFDRRLRNVKLLLRNYRMLKAHVESAVYETSCEESPLDILEDMMQGRDTTVIVESIKRSVGRTTVIVRHIDAMLGLYRAYCDRGSDEDRRRWQVVDALYIGDDQRTVKELASDLGWSEGTIYRDIDVAAERIAALMFGIDGLDKRRKE